MRDGHGQPRLRPPSGAKHAYEHSGARQRDRDGRDDIIDARPARQVRNWLRKALKKRPDGLSIGQILDDSGVAIRAGHHCAQPVMQRFGVPATARASLAFYNTKEDLDALAEAVLKVKKVFD